MGIALDNHRLWQSCTIPYRARNVARGDNALVASRNGEGIVNLNHDCVLCTVLGQPRRNVHQSPFARVAVKWCG